MSLRKIYWTGNSLHDLSGLFALMRIEKDFAMQSKVYFWLSAKTFRNPKRQNQPCSILLQWDEKGIDRKASRIQFF